MAYLSKDALIDLLTERGVSFNPTESRAALLALAQQAPEAMNQAAIEVEEADSEYGVRFHVNDLATRQRDFTPEIHGEDWKKVAAQFRESNRFSIIKEEAL